MPGSVLDPFGLATSAPRMHSASEYRWRLEIEVNQDKKTESATPGQGRQAAWIAPVVTRLAAGAAENDLGSVFDSGATKS